MSENGPFFNRSFQSVDDAKEFLQKIVNIAKPDHVFSAPVTAGDKTVITASETFAALGFGYGSGGSESENISAEPGEDANAAHKVDSGGGGGGGGTILNRPVAAIAVGPDGIEVQPIIDPTKIVIAFFTAMITILTFMSRMKQFTASEKPIQITVPQPEIVTIPEPKVVVKEVKVPYIVGTETRITPQNSAEITQ
jgi:uncharacterized spore protein YtfJ